MTYNRLENLRLSPWTQKQEWRTPALKLAAFYGVEPLVLFPHIIHLIEQPKVWKKLDAEEAYALVSDYQRGSTRSPEEIVSAREQLALAEKELKRLPGDRAKLFLEHQLYGATLRELADERGVSSGRIQQKVDRAKRVMGRTVQREVWTSRHNKNCLFCTNLRWSFLGWRADKDKMVCRGREPRIVVPRKVTLAVYKRTERAAKLCNSFYLDVDRWLDYLRLPASARRSKTFRIT